MGRRRKHHEEHANHEAWAIPYGDLITLLLAFFVVMYAISSVNEGKFRVLSDSLVAAFRGAPMSPEPIQIGSPTRLRQGTPIGQTGMVPPMAIDSPPSAVDPLGADQGMHESRGDNGFDQDAYDRVVESMSRVADQIQQAMMPLIDAELIRVRRDHFWIEVEINTSFLFASGRADLFPDAHPVLEELAHILLDLPVRVHVEGFTDDVPINTPVFPSNWELSAGRAARVLRLMAEHGLDPAQMALVGFGEHRPIADNATQEGRRQNRRVVIVIIAEEGDRRPGPEMTREIREPTREAGPGA